MGVDLYKPRKLTKCLKTFDRGKQLRGYFDKAIRSERQKVLGEVRDKLPKIKFPNYEGDINRGGEALVVTWNLAIQEVVKLLNSLQSQIKEEEK